MGDVVDLKPVHLEENQEFVADCCRFQEGILSEVNMRLKYRSFTDNIWQDLGSNEKLLAAVEDEKIRRVRTGQQKREKAQALIVKGPAILDSIAADVSASPRHRVDALKVLNDFSSNPQESSAPASDRFVITINLGADHVEVYDKSISINADDVAPNGSATPRRPLPASIPDKRWDDDVAATPVKASAPTHTGYKQAEPGRVEKTPLEIAVESMMRY